MITIHKLPLHGELHISRAVSSVGVMYHFGGPNTGSNPGGGWMKKKIILILRSQISSTKEHLLLVELKMDQRDMDVLCKKKPCTWWGTCTYYVPDSSSRPFIRGGHLGMSPRYILLWHVYVVFHATFLSIFLVLCSSRNLWKYFEFQKKNFATTQPLSIMHVNAST